MSTAKGGIHSRAPKYQNSFAYKHNKNSKKTKKISGIIHVGLCDRMPGDYQLEEKVSQV